MKVIYAHEPLEKSIFLAGPTPRSSEVPSWRPQALSILEQLGYDGTVFIPEVRDGDWEVEYDKQIHWEWEALNQCTVAAFWIPRNLESMPGFTTNVEYGLMIHSSKAVLGRPYNAPKMRYLDALAQRYNVPVYGGFYAFLEECIRKTQKPFGA